MNAIYKNVYKTCLFFSYSQEKTDKILSDVAYHIKSYKKNDVIFYEKNVREKIGIILSGTVFINKLYPNGKIVILDMRSAAELLGEDLIFSSTQPCEGERISAGSKCDIMFFSYEDFRLLLLKYEEILLNYLNYFSDKALLLKHRLGILSLSSIRSKIAAHVYNECKKNHSIVLKLQFNRSDLARFLDVSRPSLIRELNKIEMLGIIENDVNMIKVLNMEKLLGLVIQ